MKVKFIPPREDEINKFLSTPGIKPLSCRFIPAHEGDAGVINEAQFVVLYTTPEDDQAAKDKATLDMAVQLDRLMDIAREVGSEGKFTALKNNTQREIFLAARYNLVGSDAARVTELLKPEMASVLGGA